MTSSPVDPDAWPSNPSGAPEDGGDATALAEPIPDLWSPPAGEPIAADPPWGWSPQPTYAPAASTQPNPTATPTGGRAQWWIAGIACTVVVALIGATVAIAQRDTDDQANERVSLTELERGGRGTRIGLKPPPVWDEELLPYVEFVEEARGETFDEPVQVVFVTADEWAERGLDVYSTGLGSLSSSNLAYYRSLGLVDGAVAPWQLAAPTIEGVLGYYDPNDNEITVIGDGFDPLTEVVVVHELTHALQDQSVGLTDYLGGFAGYDFMSVATVESDAAWVQRQYEDQLTDQEYQAFAAAYDSRIAQVNARVGSQAGLEALVTFGQAPYLVGPGFIEQVRNADGVDGVNKFISDIPQLDEYLFDARGYLDNEREVSVPDIDTPTESLAFEEFGALYTMVVLAGGIGAEAAHNAGDLFGGGELQQYENESGLACTQLVVVGDNDAGTQLLLASFTQWATTMPSAAVTLDDQAVVVRSCDPGEPWRRTPLQGGEQHSALLARLAIVSNLEGDDLPSPVARCLATRTAAVFGDQTLNKVASARRELQATIDQFIASGVCA